jgi:hypothetical protein
MLFRPLRVFLPLACLCLVYGLGKLSIDLVRDPMISASALLTLVSALLIILIGMLGDAIATRLGRLNVHAVIGVRVTEFMDPEITAETETLAAERLRHATAPVVRAS